MPPERGGCARTHSPVSRIAGSARPAHIRKPPEHVPGGIDGGLAHPRQPKTPENIGDHGPKSKRDFQTSSTRWAAICSHAARGGARPPRTGSPLAFDAWPPADADPQSGRRHPVVRPRVTHPARARPPAGASADARAARSRTGSTGSTGLSAPGRARGRPRARPRGHDPPGSVPIGLGYHSIDIDT